MDWHQFNLGGLPTLDGTFLLTKEEHTSVHVRRPEGLKEPCCYLRVVVPHCLDLLLSDWLHLDVIAINLVLCLVNFDVHNPLPRRVLPKPPQVLRQVNPRETLRINTL